MPKRITDPEEIEKMRERIYNFRRKNISDRNSFNLEFAKELMTSEKGLSTKQKNFRDQVFKAFAKKYPQNIAKQSEIQEFEKAGGKDLSRDKLKTANVVKTKEEFRRRGAARTDLKGVDTKPRRDRFQVLGRQKGRIVYGRRTSVKVKGKEQVRFRDKKGRFISGKK